MKIDKKFKDSYSKGVKNAIKEWRESKKIQTTEKPTFKQFKIINCCNGLKFKVLDGVVSEVFINGFNVTEMERFDVVLVKVADILQTKYHMVCCGLYDVPFFETNIRDIKTKVMYNLKSSCSGIVIK